MATTGTGPVKFKRGKLYSLSPSELKEDLKNPRQTLDPDALAKMIDSIRKLGMVQPVVFRLDSQGDKIIVAGERRVAAAREAGLETIPALFVSEKFAEIALAENFVRQDLTIIEESEALHAYLTEQQFSQEELGAIVGKAQNTLSETLKLMNLPQEIRNECRGDRTIPKKTLIAMARKKTPEEMNAAYQAYKTKAQQTTTQRQKKDPNKPQLAFATLERTGSKLAVLDISAWSDDDKRALQTTIATLKNQIDAFLAANPPI